MSSTSPKSSPQLQRKGEEDEQERIEPLDLFTSETVDNLAGGFLAILEPEMVQVQRSLQELITNQEEMLQSIHDKRSQFEDTAKSSEILATLQKVPIYKNKVASIIKQMQTLNKRVKRLQQRATKLRATREQKDEQKRRELKKRMEHEQMLEAKPAK